MRILCSECKIIFNSKDMIGIPYESITGYSLRILCNNCYDEVE